MQISVYFTLSLHTFTLLGMVAATVAANPIVESKAQISPEIVAKQGKLQMLTPPQLLGKKIFFDSKLSNPVGQSCASCHAAAAGFSDPNHLAVSRGAIATRLGTRNAPSISYAAFSPYFHFDAEDETYVGGLFWDGRASTLEEQAMGPLLNHLEMNCSGNEMIHKKILSADYKNLFLSVFGPASLDDADTTCEKLATALEEYQESREVNPFTSKFDYYLRGQTQLSAQELRGLKAFNNEEKANCAACHTSTPDPLTGAVLFTDFTYDNIGIPANENLRSSNGKPDLGLGSFLKKTSENGKFKVPTLRNVAITAPYFHNGSITTLEDSIRFYSERDSGKYGAPETKKNLNTEELGNLKLTDQEIADITAFLRTLTDSYKLADTQNK